MITDTIINKKQLDRATRMRDGDDETTIDALKEVVASSMVAQTARSKKMVQRSLEEVNQVARDIVNGQIKMDETRKKKFVGRLKNLSDDMKSQMENGDFEKKSEKVTQSLKDVLPSPQTLMSAVMTANPMLGFAMRTGGAVKGAIGSAKSSMVGADPNEEIEATKQSIDDNFDLVKKQSQDATDQLTSSLNPFDSEQAVNVLMGIEREMISLRKIWDDNDDTQSDIRTTLEDIRDTDEEQLKQARLQRESAEAQATEDRRESKRVDESGNVVGGMSGDGEDDTDSMLESILGGFAGGGFMAGLSAVFGVIKSVATVGLKFVGKATLIGGAILAIYDFVDGFFDAANILDKEEGDVTIKDRIVSGIGSVISGFLGFINTITSWFGLDFMSFFEGDPEKIIAQGINKAVDTLISGFTSIFDRWKNIFSNVIGLFTGEESVSLQMIKDAVIGVGKDLLAIPITLANSILSAFGIVDKLDDEQVNGAIDKALGFIKDSIGKALDWMLDLLNFDIDFSSIAGDVGDMVSGVTDDIKNFVSDTVSDTWNGIKSFVGLGDDDDEEEKETDDKKPKRRGGRGSIYSSDNVSSDDEEENVVDKAPKQQPDSIIGSEPYSEVSYKTSYNRVPAKEDKYPVHGGRSFPQRPKVKKEASVSDNPPIMTMFDEYLNPSNTTTDSIKGSVKSPDEYVDSGSMVKSLEDNNVIITSEQDIISYFDGIIKGASTVSEIKNTEASERQKEETEKSQGGAGGQTMINAPSNVSNNVTNTTVQTTDNTSNKDFSFNRMSYMPYRMSYE